MNNDEKQFEDFVYDIEFDDKPRPDHRDRIEHDLMATLQTRHNQKRLVSTKRPLMKLAAAAVIMICVFGGLTFWPDDEPGKGQWWLGPSNVWAKEIIDYLETVEALVYRSQFVFVGQYGWTHVSGNWDMNYKARDRYRKDTYYEPTDEDTLKDNRDDSVLHRATWNVPDGNDAIQYNVSYELECYTMRRHKKLRS